MIIKINGMDNLTSGRPLQSLRAKSAFPRHRHIYFSTKLMSLRELPPTLFCGKKNMSWQRSSDKSPSTF